MTEKSCNIKNNCVCSGFDMPRGRPSTGREEYARVKLKNDTHLLWTERKRILQRRDWELSNNMICAFTRFAYYIQVFT